MHLLNKGIHFFFLLLYLKIHKKTDPKLLNYSVPFIYHCVLLQFKYVTLSVKTQLKYFIYLLFSANNQDTYCKEHYVNIYSWYL